MNFLLTMEIFPPCWGLPEGTCWFFVVHPVRHKHTQTCGSGLEFQFTIRQNCIQIFGALSREIVFIPGALTSLVASQAWRIKWVPIHLFGTRDILKYLYQHSSIKRNPKTAGKSRYTNCHNY